MGPNDGPRDRFATPEVDHPKECASQRDTTVRDHRGPRCTMGHHSDRCRPRRR